VNAELIVDDGPAIEVDFLWRARRLAIETDAFGTHGTRQSFERDRLRDQRLKLAGYDSLRFTHRQIASNPGGVVATLTTLLARPAATGPRS
jgi:very-short-patch-repair endonuclease